MRTFLFCVILMCGTSQLDAQTLVEDPAVTRMMASFVEHNKANTQVRGWRIQIMSTTDRRVMEDAQARFKRIYPEYELLFVHQNPYYHLKTGAFLSQQDARPLLKKLQRVFPAAFVVTDQFEINEVLTYLE